MLPSFHSGSLCSTELLFINFSSCCQLGLCGGPCGVPRVLVLIHHGPILFQTLSQPGAMAAPAL